eukprot:7384119-Prymnesium_polylepis.1
MPHALPSMPACRDRRSRGVGHARGAWRAVSVGALLRRRGRFVPKYPFQPLFPSCFVGHA